MGRRQPSFDLIEYLADQGREGFYENGHISGDESRIPSLNELSKEKGISVATLREQLGVARALGIVEVRPKTGIRRLDYSFAPAVMESLTYAVALNRANFDKFADLRKHVELAYWYQAVECLTEEDKQELSNLIERAWAKLHANPIRIPHKEHRDLHLTMFNRLDNLFVLGIVEAYWDAYEEVGLARYEGLNYLETVWDYHRRIVQAICDGNFKSGYALLVEHMELIDTRPE